MFGAVGVKHQTTQAVMGHSEKATFAQFLFIYQMCPLKISRRTTLATHKIQMIFNFRKKQSVLFYCSFKVDKHYYIVWQLVNICYKARSRFNFYLFLCLFSAQTSAPNGSVTPKTETKNGEDLTCLKKNYTLIIHFFCPYILCSTFLRNCSC